MSIGTIIADHAKLSLSYANRMLADVPADKFARFAMGENGLIESNHPAFIYGHLSLYSPRIVEHFGGDMSEITPSDKFIEAFDQSAQCVDDPDGTIYPAMEEITSKLIKSTELAIETIATASDEELLKPNANEKMAKYFATNGSMMGFYLSGHIMIHMGQMSAWRRMIGLGPA